MNITNIPQRAYEVRFSAEELAFLRMVLGLVRKDWCGKKYVPDDIKPPIEFLVKHKIDPLLDRLTPDEEKEKEKQTLILGKIPLAVCEELPPNSVAVVSEAEAVVKEPKAKAHTFPPRKTLSDPASADDKERLKKVAHEASQRLGIPISEISIQLYGRRNAIANYKAPSTAISTSAIDEMCKKIESLSPVPDEEPDLEDTIFAGIYLRRDKDHLASPGPEYAYLTVSNLLSAAQWCAKFSTNRMVKDHIALEGAEIDAVRQCKPLLAHIKRMAETDRGQFDKNFAAFVSECRARWVGGWVKLARAKGVPVIEIEEETA